MHRFTSMMLALIALSSCGVALAACGGDSTSSEQAAESPVPEPAETIDEFAQRFEDAAAAAVAGDCDQVEEFNEQATFPIACPQKAGNGDALAGLEVVDAQQLGTGGIVDWTSEAYPEGVTELAALEESGRYYPVRDVIPTQLGMEFGQVGTEPDETAVRDQVLEDWLAAMRERDCETWFHITITPTDNQEKECRFEFEEGKYMSELPAYLTEHPDTTPELLAESQAASVYGLEEEEVYRTIILLRQYEEGVKPTPEEGYRVINYRAQSGT